MILYVGYIRHPSPMHKCSVYGSIHEAHSAAIGVFVRYKIMGVSPFVEIVHLIICLSPFTYHIL